MRAWLVGASALLGLMPACFSPALPAVACGDGNVCPSGLVCDLDSRICAAPSVADDAGASDGQPDARADAGPLPAMIDRGLIARYFIDEAASGTAPTQVLDATADPVHLAISYDGNLTYTSQDANRGLRWAAVGTGGTVIAELANGKIEDALDGATTTTTEMVMDLEAVSAQLSHFVYVGKPDGEGDFAQGAVNSDAFGLAYADGLGLAIWPQNLVNPGRVVVHLVFESDLATDTDRLRLYVDGVLVGGRGGDDPARGEGIPLDNNAELSLGNRPVGDRSMAGTIFYFGLYSTALDPAELVQNAARLLQSDDM